RYLKPRRMAKIPPTSLAFAHSFLRFGPVHMQNDQYLGIEIGGTKLQLVIGDAHSRIVQRKRLSVDISRGGEGIRHQIESTLREWSSHSFSGVGVGFGGPVDWRTGRICCSHQVE